VHLFTYYTRRVFTPRISLQVRNIIAKNSELQLASEDRLAAGREQSKEEILSQINMSEAALQDRIGVFESKVLEGLQQHAGAAGADAEAANTDLSRQIQDAVEHEVREISKVLGSKADENRDAIHDLLLKTMVPQIINTIKPQIDACGVTTEHIEAMFKEV